MNKKEKFSYDDLRPGRNYQCKIDEWPSAIGSNAAFYPQRVLDTVRHGRTSVCHIHYINLSVEILLSGTLTYFQEGRKVQIKAGEVFLCPPGKNSGFYSNDTEHYHKLTMIAEGAAIDLLVNSLHLKDVLKITPRHPEAIEQRFREIQNLLRTKTPGSENLIAERAFGLLLILSHEVQSNDQGYPETLRNALGYIHGSCTQCRLSLKELANHTGVSTATLGRLFSKHCGKSPMAYIMEMRMELAKNLLRTSQLSIKEIAVRVGFNDPLYFSAAFHRYTGHFPKSFRNNFLTE